LRAGDERSANSNREIIDVDFSRPRDLDAPGYLEKRDRIFT